MKPLDKYLDSRQKAITDLLKLPKKSYTDDSFHDLRVEIKKLDALFDLINAVKKSFQRKKTFKPFKKVFRQAGKVRELQVEKAMLAEHSPGNLLEYRNHLNELVSKEEKEYTRLLKKKLFKRLRSSFQKASKHLKRIKEKEIDPYILENKKMIDQILAKPVDVTHAHDLRKRLKTFNYNVKCLELKDYENELLSDTLPNMLGKWQDYRVTVRHMEEAKKRGEIQDVEVGQLEEIMGEFSSESERLFDELNAAILTTNL